MNATRRRPTLAEQGRQLAELQARILEIQDDAELRAHAQPRHAQAYFAQAETEAAPLIAQGAALRDAILLRARHRAKLAWGVVYVAGSLIVVMIVFQLL